MEKIVDNICPGCGQEKQDQDPSLSNYVMSMDFKYCMRCFRWQHYKDLPLLLNPIINVNQHEDLPLVEHDEMMIVIDSLFLKETLLPLVPWISKANKVNIVATKLDLYPKQITPVHVYEQIHMLLKEDIQYVSMVFVTSTKIKETMDALRDYVLTKDNNYRFLFVGMINAGKSTLLNTLKEDDEITTSPYPQTTIDPIVTQYHHVQLIDTPGLSAPSHLFYHLSPKDYEKIVPTKAVSPITFQVFEDSSILIGNLAIIDVETDVTLSVSVYVSNLLSVARYKRKETLVNKLSKKEYKTTILKPYKEGLDFIIEGVGKVHIVNQAKSVTIKHHKALTISKSKGTLLW